MAPVNIRTLLLLTLIIKRRRQQMNVTHKYKKRFWVRKIFQERKLKGEYHLLVKDLKLFDHEFFFKQFRMLPNKYEKLHSYIAPIITKSSVRRRKYICRSASLYHIEISSYWRCSSHYFKQLSRSA